MPQLWLTKPCAGPAGDGKSSNGGWPCQAVGDLTESPNQPADHESGSILPPCSSDDVSGGQLRQRHPSSRLRLPALPIPPAQPVQLPPHPSTSRLPLRLGAGRNPRVAWTCSIMPGTWLTKPCAWATTRCSTAPLKNLPIGAGPTCGRRSPFRRAMRQVAQKCVGVAHRRRINDRFPTHRRPDFGAHFPILTFRIRKSAMVPALF